MKPSAPSQPGILLPCIRGWSRHKYKTDLAAVGAWIEAYLLRYPHTRVEVEYTSCELNLVHEDFDVGVRAGPLQESRLLGQIENGLFAAA